MQILSVSDLLRTDSDVKSRYVPGESMLKFPRNSKTQHPVSTTSPQPNHLKESAIEGIEQVKDRPF
jgi:hypothetical protein